jgi:hypothetical protein
MTLKYMAPKTMALKRKNVVAVKPYGPRTLEPLMALKSYIIYPKTLKFVAQNSNNIKLKL